MGDTTHLPERHVHMTERRFSKLDLLEDGTFESDNHGLAGCRDAVGRLQGPGRRGV